MPENATGGVTLLVLILTWTLNTLFGLLIARAMWRAYTLKSTMVYLNDSLERIRAAITHEVLSWGGGMSEPEEERRRQARNEVAAKLSSALTHALGTGLTTEAALIAKLIEATLTNTSTALLTKLK